MGLAPRKFGRLFGDAEGARLAVFELAVGRAAARIVPESRAAPRWLDAVRAATAAFLRFVEDEPALGHVLALSSLGAEERLIRRRMEVLDVLVDAIDAGDRERRRGVPRQPRVIAEGVVGALAAVAQRHLLSERTQPPIELYGSLVSIAVLPYLGAAVARRELGRPAPRRAEQRAAERAGRSRPAAGRGGRRLTYRSARVLAVIGAHPGASNSEVAARAGIVDQGQASKLLARLRDGGLVELARGAPARGTPNAWRLTEAGRRAAEDAQPSVNSIERGVPESGARVSR